MTIIFSRRTLLHGVGVVTERFPGSDSNDLWSGWKRKAFWKSCLFAEGCGEF